MSISESIAARALTVPQILALMTADGRAAYTLASDQIAAAWQLGASGGRVSQMVRDSLPALCEAGRALLVRNWM